MYINNISIIFLDWFDWWENMNYAFIMTVTLSVHHAIPKHQQLDCLTNCSRWQQRNIKALHYWVALCEGNVTALVKQGLWCGKHFHVMTSPRWFFCVFELFLQECGYVTMCKQQPVAYSHKGPVMQCFHVMSDMFILVLLCGLFLQEFNPMTLQAPLPDSPLNPTGSRPVALTFVFQWGQYKCYLISKHYLRWPFLPKWTNFNSSMDK